MHARKSWLVIGEKNRRLSGSRDTLNESLALDFVLPQHLLSTESLYTTFQSGGMLPLKALLHKIANWVQRKEAVAVGSSSATSEANPVARRFQTGLCKASVQRGLSSSLVVPPFCVWVCGGVWGVG